MRFRRWPRPTRFEDTTRKRAALIRKQRLEREALPLFSDQIAVEQPAVDTVMHERGIDWIDAQRERCRDRAARWHDVRRRLFALDGALRAKVRRLWRNCPYPADLSYFADLLHQVERGRIDPERPPWVFHQTISARTTPNPRHFDEAFRKIGACKVGGGPKTTAADELLFCGNLGSGMLFCAHGFGSSTRTRASTPAPITACVTLTSGARVTGSISKCAANAPMTISLS